MKRLLFTILTITLSITFVFTVLEIFCRLKNIPGEGNTRSDRFPIAYFPEPDREHPWIENNSDPLRIAIVGDSFTEGTGVQVDYRYAARLERLMNLNSGVRPAVVEVFAKSGTSTYQQRRLVRKATGSPEAVTRLRFPQNVACGFPALRSSRVDSQHSETLQLPVW